LRSVRPYHVSKTLGIERQADGTIQLFKRYYARVSVSDNVHSNLFRQHYCGPALVRKRTRRCLLKAQLKGRLELSDAERATLGEIGHRLGWKVLGEVANMARPDTILAWCRTLVARKFDGCKALRPWPGSDQARGRATDRSLSRVY
jgi:hypothetical protein